jgi:endoglucanase
MINATSGDESAVRNYIISKIDGKCEYSVDSLGSVIAFKKGKRTPKNKVMLCAHMDEVGFIITDIDDEGYLHFSAVGGIDARVAVDRKVRINDIYGVIGLKPVHLMKDEELATCPDIKKLFIDIGAKSREEAQKFISLGDNAYFVSDYVEFGNGFVKSKALDDRIGCMYLIELINSELEYDTYFCFNVQEEVGLRGAECTAYAVKPDISVILESTTAGDLCSVKGGERVCVLGNGGVVSFMDRRTIYDKELYNLAVNTAKDNGIPVQTKTAIAGGNDAGAVQTAAGGCKVLAISVPTRYIHSASSVAKLSDIDNTRRLINAVLPKLYD